MTMTSRSIIKLSPILNFIDDKKIFSKGENSFECGYVANVKYLSEVGHLSGQVHASMKNKLYTVEVFFKETEIERASCPCPTGQIKCHHMVSLLLHGHKNISVTDVACVWSKKITKNDETVKTIDDLYPNSYKAINNPEENKFKAFFYNKLSQTNKTVGFSWLLMPDSPQQDLNNIKLLETVIFSEEFRLSKNKKEMLSKYFEFDYETIQKIASETVGQTINIKWSLYRQFRLTSSNFHRILKSIRNNRYPSSLYKTLLGQYSVNGVKSIEWGKNHDNTAILEFENTYSCKVAKTGIWLHESGLLGASPDGLLIDDNISCIEVKCPYKLRDQDLKIALSQSDDYILKYDNDENEFKLNLHHEYYDQIQGQMHLTKTLNTILIIWKLKSLVAVRVNIDEDWSNNITHLLNFYHEQFIPYLLTNCI